MTTAFDPLDLSGKALANRIAVAPMLPQPRLPELMGHPLHPACE